MSHLTASDLIDVLDGTLPAEGGKHLETCRACRRQVEDMRATLESAAEVQVPEPSPLFWRHFSANVRQEIERRGDGGTWTAWLHGHRVLATVAAAAIVAGVTVAWHTQRLVPSQERVLVGAAGTYEARCRRCFDPTLART